jgi:hypothetical protein
VAEAGETLSAEEPAAEMRPEETHEET